MSESAEDSLFWMIALDELIPGKQSAYIAFTSPERLRNGHRPSVTRTPCPVEMILGRPSIPTDTDMAEYKAAQQANPDINIEGWFSFLEPTNDQIVAFADKFNADPLRFTDEEIDFLSEILPLMPKPHSGGRALNVLTTWRWGEPWNIAYEPYFFPNLSVVSKDGRSPIQIPSVGYLLLKRGKVKAIAVGRVPETDLIRVVTLEDSNCMWKIGLHFEIFQYSLFEIDDCLFRHVT